MMVCTPEIAETAKTKESKGKYYQEFHNLKRMAEDGENHDIVEYIRERGTSLYAYIKTLSYYTGIM